MLEEYGEFWEKRGDARCITTNGILRENGKAIMGAGVALQARDRYLKEGIDLETILGRLIKRHGNHVYYLGNNLFSFPTKHHWKEKSDIELIKRSVRELVLLVDKLDYKRILLTRPGCGQGGLEWKNVKPIIQHILDNRFIIVAKDSTEMDIHGPSTVKE